MQEDTRFHPWPLFDRVHYKYIWCEHTFTHIQKKNLGPFFGRAERLWSSPSQVPMNANLTASGGSQTPGSSPGPSGPSGL